METDMIEIDLGVVHHFAGGLYAKEMLLPAKHFAVSHAHAYDHLSILAKGSVTVEVQGVRTEYTAPACINVLAGEHHTITAHEDSVWFCVHATDETDVEKIDSVLVRG
jgi:quercetin dioxygenase-like cupin family protein